MSTVKKSYIKSNEHFLVTVSRTGKRLNVSMHYSETNIYPDGYRYFMFRGSWGKILVCFYRPHGFSESDRKLAYDWIFDNFYCGHNPQLLGECDSQGEIYD